MLTAVWSGMLADARPFDAPKDNKALGIEALLVLTLVATADPQWTLPPPLMRRAVASALRAQACDANQWIGFVRKKGSGERMFELETSSGVGVGARVRNALRAVPPRLASPSASASGATLR